MVSNPGRGPLCIVVDRPHRSSLLVGRAGCGCDRSERLLAARRRRLLAARRSTIYQRRGRPCGAAFLSLFGEHVRRPAPMIAATRLALAQAVRVRGASQPSGARTTAGFGDAGLSATMLHRYRNDQEATLAIAGWTAKCGSPMRRSAVDYPRPRECAPPGPVSGKAV